MDDANRKLFLKCFISVLAFLGLVTLICPIESWINYKNMESKRAIMFKLTDSDYVCEDLIEWAKENL